MDKETSNYRVSLWFMLNRGAMRERNPHPGDKAADLFPEHWQDFVTAQDHNAVVERLQERLADALHERDDLRKQASDRFKADLAAVAVPEPSAAQLEARHRMEGYNAGWAAHERATSPPEPLRKCHHKFDVMVICDAYESGLGQGLQNRPMGEYKNPHEVGSPAAHAYQFGYDEGSKRHTSTKEISR